MNNCYKSKLSVFVFAAPALIIFTAFVAYPIIPEIIISFQEHDGFQSYGFVGLSNYASVLSSPTFWKSCINTLIVVALSLLAALPISLILALAIDKQTPGVKNFFKFTSVFPAVMSVTVISQMWIAIYEPQWGLLNTILEKIGLGSLTHVWLTDKSTVMVCIAFAFLWQHVGINCLLFYSGIKSIPTSYYEAAQIDGAGFWQASWNITIPLLKDVSKYVVTTSTLGSLGMFAYVKAMTAGGPGDASRTVTYQMYYQAFGTSEFGKGSAVAVLFIIVCIIVAFIINKSFGNERIEY